MWPLFIDSEKERKPAKSKEWEQTMGGKEKIRLKGAVFFNKLIHLKNIQYIQAFNLMCFLLVCVCFVSFFQLNDAAVKDFHCKFICCVQMIQTI